MKDIITGAITTIIGLAIFIMARQMQSPVPGFGPEVFPTMIGAALVILGILLMGQGFMSGEKFRKGDQTPYFWVAPLTVGLTVVYIFSLPALPFLIITPLYLLILTALGRYVKLGIWKEAVTWRLIAFITIVSAIIYVVFRYIFNVALN